MSDVSPVMTTSATPPTFEEYRDAHQPIGLSSDAKRLKWALEGPLNTAIEVMHGMKYEPGVPAEPYGDLNAPTPTWHQISRSPLTEPTISSVIVHIEIVEDWEHQWLEFHRFCHHPDENGSDPEEFLFGDLPDYDSDSDEEEEVHLLRCCRGDRPRKKGETLLVKASGTFLTIHDYVSAVHPWLLERREDIFGAEGDLMKNKALAAKTKLMISYGLPDQVNFETEKDWRESMSQEPFKVDYTDTRSVFERPIPMRFIIARSHCWSSDSLNNQILMLCTCGATAPDVANRQNAHSMTLAFSANIKLFPAHEV
ncbi:hypothetical protein DE146DRAFT_767706 [Phaeosphaeria sp. MPI-PUGE-AT-0046c]|nr:hypothetical protein DE146DRAFT_767706 [Phaeosphaeria sp. MPI-PUGE-AT-0046c]